MKKEITGHTKLLCVLGSPIGHSKSPQMHNESIDLLGLDYRYLAFDVTEDRLEPVVNGLKAMGARGFNLTMPLKNHMVELCDHLSTAAELCQAVNTVVIEEDGSLTGHTTDGIGFWESAREEGFESCGKKITQFGAGGAGTAMLVQAALDGAREISLFTRTSSPFHERTRMLVQELNSRTDCVVRIFDYEEADLRRELGESQILVNATNIGMAPNPDRCLIPDASYFHEGLMVGDVIYNPLETKLMSMAREAGLKTFGGLHMLLYQGAESFRLWTGKCMPVEEIKAKYF